MEEDRGHCSHLTCGSRGFPVTETDLDRPMGSTAEEILGKSGSGGPPSLGMAVIIRPTGLSQDDSPISM